MRVSGSASVPVTHSHVATSHQRASYSTAGVLAVLTAVVLWGVQLPVATLAFAHVDPYHLTSIRYGVTALLLVPLLVYLATWVLAFAGDRNPDETGDPVLRVLEGGEAVTVAALAAATGLPTDALLSRLTLHEVAGRVARLPGGAFRTVSAPVVR